MSNYDEEYMATRDIDWFGMVNGRMIHVASCGGLLPEEFISDKDYLRDLQYEVAMRTELLDNGGNPIGVSHNDAYIEQRLQGYEDINDIKKSYLASFDSFARKGFWSFDKCGINNAGDNHYRLISWPTNGETIHLESEIRYNRESIDLNFEIPEALEEIDLLNLPKKE